jgi:hypothetical protein
MAVDTLPQAIRRQVQSAADIQAQLDAAAAPPAPTPPAPVAPPPITVVVPPQPAVPAAQPAPISDGATVQLQGLIAVNEQLRNTISQMGAQMTEMQAAMTRANTPPAPPPGFKEDDVKVFGPDVMEMVDRKMAAALVEVRNIAGQITQRISDIENRLGVVNNKADYTVEQQFVMNLTKLVPNWSQVNEEPGWHAFLREMEPMSGKHRQEFLNDASKAYDAQRVAAIFRAYEATKATAPTPPAATNTPQGLEEQIAPPTAAPAAAPTPAEAPAFTVSQVQSFYNDVVHNRYRGREQEMARIDAQINAAVAANRIIPG